VARRCIGRDPVLPARAGRFAAGLGGLDGLAGSAPTLGGPELPTLRGASPNGSFQWARSDSGPGLQPIPESPAAARQEGRLADLQRVDRV
jgi:hypothetical protein